MKYEKSWELVVIGKKAIYQTIIPRSRISVLLLSDESRV